MQFDVSVQGTFYKTITAPNTGSALAAVSTDIANGLVPNLNPDLIKLIQKCQFVFDSFTCILF